MKGVFQRETRPTDWTNEVLCFYRAMQQLGVGRLAWFSSATRTLVVGSWTTGGSQRVALTIEIAPDKIKRMPGKGGASQAAADNRSNQMNPNNDAYYSSRGESSAADSAPKTTKR